MVKVTIKCSSCGRKVGTSFPENGWKPSIRCTCGATVRLSTECPRRAPEGCTSTPVSAGGLPNGCVPEVCERVREGQSASDAASASVFYVLQWNRHEKACYRVARSLRLVACAMLEEWEEEQYGNGDVSATWSLGMRPTDGIRVVDCYECANCGGIVDGEGFGPLDCGCHIRDWSGLPRVLSAVMNLRNHTARQVALRMAGVSEQAVKSWLSGEEVPGRHVRDELRYYLHGGG